VSHAGEKHIGLQDADEADNLSPCTANPLPMETMYGNAGG
jgi:hypothetical protein